MLCAILVVIAVLIILVLSLKLYLKVTSTWDPSFTCLNGKTVIVTGSNTGIGYQTAADLAKRGARVILACRDLPKAEEAKNSIIQASGNNNVVVKHLDLASLDSVRQFAQDVLKTEERLDILINNAGAFGLPSSTTKDGLSLLMQINYFGHFLLTLLLLGLLKKSAPSRVVNVSSSLAYVDNLNPDDLNSFPIGIFRIPRDYANTKLCNILFTFELAKKLQGTGITTNSLDPGPVKTDVARNSPKIIQLIHAPISTLFYKTVQEGAQTSIFVAVSKEVENISGEFFRECAVSNMIRKGKDKALAEKVWKNSVSLVRLTEEEKGMLNMEFKGFIN